MSVSATVTQRRKPSEVRSCSTRHQKIYRWPNISKLLIGLNQNHCCIATNHKFSFTEEMKRSVFRTLALFQVGPHLLSVCRGQTAAHHLLRLLDPPPEAVAISRHFLPVSFTGRLTGKRPGVHDVDLDYRRKLHLEHKQNRKHIQNSMLNNLR